MDYAVEFKDVSKEYPFYQHMTAGFKSFLFNLPKNIASLKKTKFIALRDVFFEVKKGETFGIIGRNGSGKSTILGLVAGVMKPDRGIVRTSGKISSLLELGSGFHPDLSGIENIVLNGILAGNTKEDMLRKMGMITEFSELGDFIYQPLRTYSSGMQMRLGFSVAVHIDPELLLIDEALSVGDVNFQEKCADKMMAFKRSGATILLVSHDMPSIAKLCDRAAWIDSGRVMEIGEPIAVINGYLKHLGQPVIAEDEDGEPMIEKEAATEVKTLADDTLINQRTAETSEPLVAASSQNIGRIAPPATVIQTWWDSPIILRQCEERITGDNGTNLYEFLKREYSIAGLQKGLCISAKLKGIEDNFIKYDICKSFDTYNGPEEINDLLAGSCELKRGSYDFFLCIDVLSRIEVLDGFLSKVTGSLRDKGRMIALEYVGPSHFRWADREREIAGALSDALDKAVLNEKERGFDVALALQLESGNITNIVESNSVIVAAKKFFDILSVRYFAGPLHDIVLNKILNRVDQSDEKDIALMRTIIQCERIMVKKGILHDVYAMIIGRKRLR
jgi:lipopolysaccharide transport system ATP-binding protein